MNPVRNLKLAGHTKSFWFLPLIFGIPNGVNTKVIIHWFIASLAIIITAYLLPGVRVSGFLAALVAALVLGLINAILRPIFILLTLPINILTLGLFTLVINALLIMLTSAIVPGFEVRGFGWAMLFGIVLFFVNWFLRSIGGKAHEI